MIATASRKKPARRKQTGGRNQNSTEKARAKILLVDDHEVLRQGMRLLIEHQSDLQVCGEADDEATDSQQCRSPPPDRLITDLSLREGDGIELIKRIKLRAPEARMLVSSMHDERVYGERVL